MKTEGTATGNEEPAKGIAPPHGDALSILGLQLHNVDVDGVHRYIEDVIASRRQALVLNLNVHACNLASADPALRSFLNSAQMVFCDGDGVRLGMRILGREIPPKITYAVWMWQLGAFCAEKGFSLYLLGAAPGVAAQAAKNMQERFPRLRIAGTHHGYFEKEGPESDAVVADINHRKPHIVIVGFGMPAQEFWLQRNWRAVDSNIFLTGGACFDYVSGRISQTPDWARKVELEWAYRWTREPKRLLRRYLLGNPLFIANVLREKVGLL